MTPDFFLADRVNGDVSSPANIVRQVHKYRMRVTKARHGRNKKTKKETRADLWSCLILSAVQCRTDTYQMACTSGTGR